MIRILHTADWQLGLKLRYLRPERAAQLRLLRFQTVRAIARLANAEQVDLVVVAGDVLDDNALGRDALQQTSDALRDFGTVLVLLLPGNHDAASPDSALARLELPANVRVLTTREPVPYGDAIIYPCPLLRRHEIDDPTAWIPLREPGDPIRIAIAHGGVIDFSQAAESETPNLIDANVVLAKGIDYLALGDWHGTFRYSDRAWYSGAHEATRFKEIDPGGVLIVEIDAAGVPPRVRRIDVAQTHWHTIAIEMLDDHQVDELKARLEALPERSQSLVNLVVTGALSMSASDALDALIADYSERLAYLRANLTGLQTQPTDADLLQLSAEGFMAGALSRLRASADPIDAEAIRLMYRLQREAAHASA